MNRRTKSLLKKTGLKPFNRNAGRRAFLSAFSRLVGVLMAAGSGAMIAQTIGPITSLGGSILIVGTIICWLLIWFLEYEREIE